MDINNEIISFLFSVGKVNLPGLGLLRLDKSSSIINPAKTKISGPKYSVSFTEKEFDEKSHHKFVEYLSNKYSKDREYFEEKIKKTSAVILNNILNFGSTEIKNLGTISIKNEKKVFEMMPFLQEILDKSYPNLPMVYINRKNDIDFIDERDKKNITGLYTQKRKRNSKGWIFPLIMLTLISLLFVFLLYCLFYVIDLEKSEKTKDIAQTEIAVIKDTTTTKDTSLTAEDKIFDQYAENDSVSDIEKISSKSDKNKEETQISNRNKTKKINKKTTRGNNNELKNLDKINLTELLNFGPELINQYDKSCIIIVGSFVKRSNASKMLQKMYDYGFAPYVERYGEFHRTGVIFDCNDRPLYDFLQNLRDTIDKDSWILKYR